MPWARPRAACAPAWGSFSRWPRTTRRLKANESFQFLSQRISGLENGIADRREACNEAVNLNNVRIEQFPDLLIARVAGFKAAELLQFSEAEKADVDLKALFG